MSWWELALILMGSAIVGIVLGSAMGTQTAREMIPELRKMSFLRAMVLLTRLGLRR